MLVQFEVIIIKMFFKILFFIFLAFILFMLFPDAKEREKRKIIKNTYSQIEKKGDLNKKNNKGDAFIHSAIWYKDLELFKLLLDNDADIGIRDKNGRTPLIYASLFDYREMVKLLLEKGADPNEKDFSGNTSLHWAAQNGSYESAVFLIEAGANIDAVKDRDRQPLHCAVDFQRASLIGLFVKHGADPNLMGKKDDSLLSITASQEDAEAVKILIEKGAVMPPDELNKCMNDLARYKQNAEVLKLIADYGDKKYGGSGKLNYPLYYAAERILDLETVASLIEKGADVETVISEIRKEYGIKIKLSKKDTPLKIAEKIVVPLRKAVAKRKRKQDFENFIEYDLQRILTIGVHVLFILIPTLYLCFAGSWLYLLIPGIPFALFGWMVFSASRGPSATGDIQGMGIVLILLGLDVFLMLLMTGLAIWKFKSG